MVASAAEEAGSEEAYPEVEHAPASGGHTLPTPTKRPARQTGIPLHSHQISPPIQRGLATLPHRGHLAEIPPHVDQMPVDPEQAGGFGSSDAGHDTSRQETTRTTGDGVMSTGG